MTRACSMYIFSDQTLLRSFVIWGRYLRANSSSCCISLISFVQSTFLLLLLFFSPTSYTLLLRLKAYLLKLFLPEKYILEEISYFDSGLKWKYCVNIRHTSALKPQGKIGLLQFFQIQFTGLCLATCFHKFLKNVEF